MVLTTGLRNLKDTGKILRTSIFSMFAQTPLQLGIADLVIALSTGLCVPLQQAFQREVLSWGRGGYWLQHAIQAAWLGIWVYLPFYLKWQWLGVESPGLVRDD